MENFLKKRKKRIRRRKYAGSNYNNAGLDDWYYCYDGRIWCLRFDLFGNGKKETEKIENGSWQIYFGKDMAQRLENKALSLVIVYGNIIPEAVVYKCDSFRMRDLTAHDIIPVFSCQRVPCQPAPW